MSAHPSKADLRAIVDAQIDRLEGYGCKCGEADCRGPAIEALVALYRADSAREIVGYRVRWTDPNGGRGQTAYGVGGREGYDVADCKRRAADKRKALAVRGCTFIVVTAIVCVSGERGRR